MWRLGDVSPQFEISERHLRRAIERAMSVWEKAAGMKLFVYDSSFGFPIDLVYADQKVLWDAKRAAERTLEHQRQSLTQADRVSDDAMARFTLAKLQFETKRAAYETRLTAYNREVHAVNASGGATPSVEALLETEKANLEEEKARLEGDARGLESLQSEANRLVERRNQQAQEINKAVQAFNTKFGSVNVRLGECERTKDEVTCIRIFAYSDEGHLAIVLAHELGHALGIGDFEADGHLMTGVENGRKSSNSLRLTAMDKAALRDVLR
jgi:DNA repair exonuclease SbcCD ATPase subunit